MARRHNPLYAVYVAATFLLCLVLLFPFIALLSLMPGSNGRRSIHRVISVWCSGWLWCIGMPLRVSGDRPDQEKFVIVVNHVSYLDTLLVFPAVGHYFRPLGKAEITSIPLLGYIYEQIVIPVDRSSMGSRARSLKAMRDALTSECSIVIFPEGGFNETPAVLKPFYDGAFSLALSAGVPIIPLVLPDTLLRWHYSKWYRLSPGKNRAIFLQPVQPRASDSVGSLKQRVFELMEAELAPYRAQQQQQLEHGTRPRKHVS